jgi:response regulator of citrate/malate metabolism
MKNNKISLIILDIASIFKELEHLEKNKNLFIESSIIIMSGSEEEKYIEKMSIFGDFDFVQKPFSSELIAKRIKMCFEERDYNKKEIQLEEDIELIRIKNKNSEDQMEKIIENLSENIEEPIDSIAKSLKDLDFLKENTNEQKEMKETINTILKTLTTKDLYNPIINKIKMVRRSYKETNYEEKLSLINDEDQYKKKEEFSSEWINDIFPDIDKFEFNLLNVDPKNLKLIFLNIEFIFKDLGLILLIFRPL